MRSVCGKQTRFERRWFCCFSFLLIFDLSTRISAAVLPVHLSSLALFRNQPSFFLRYTGSMRLYKYWACSLVPQLTA